MVAVTQPSAGMLDDELFEMDDADDAKGAQPRGPPYEATADRSHPRTGATKGAKGGAAGSSAVGTSSVGTWEDVQKRAGLSKWLPNEVCFSASAAVVAAAAPAEREHAR